MGEDASLDDFLGGGSSEQSEAADAEAADAEPADEAESAGETEQTDSDEPKTDATDPEPAADTDDVEPAKTTYAWSDEGTTCEACGETVERRWQQAGGLVCIECKDWERA